MNKKNGLLLGGALLGAVVLMPRGQTGGNQGGSGGFGGFTVTKPAIGNTAPAPIYQLPSVTVNEASFDTYQPATTKKEQSVSLNGGSSSGYVAPSSVGSVQDYNALPEGSLTKKAFKSQYPISDEGNGLTSQPTYGLGAGGTKTYTPKPVSLAPKPTENKSWWSGWF